MFGKVKLVTRRFLNVRMAIVGSLLLGSLVFYINYSYGIIDVKYAALKQACYTFFVAGLITRLNETIARSASGRWRALCLATISSSFMSIGLTLGLHNLRGTPEPLLSTVPTILLAPPGFAILAWREQRKTVQSNITNPNININN
ncbi:hypothetical protein A9Q81_13015 [Gammaproteobacteria bacterium 42_54_T18]|nr:hypothetical protein A9Q81_13015 [Gammaproteobacteria bacterium 42_54_T18]